MSHVAPQISSSEQQPNRINPRIFLLALGMFALGTDAFVVAGVLPVIAKDTGVTEGLAGQLVTVFALTYALGAPILAAITSRWSRNRVLIGAIGLFALTNLGSALAPTFTILMITRILAGCFAATFAPLAYTIGISLAPPAKRGQALALVVIGLTMATVLGSPLGTWVGTQFGWRFAFGLVVVLAGIAFLAILLCGLPKATPQPTLSLGARLAPIAQARVLLTLLPALMWNIGVFMLYTYIAPLLQHNLSILNISALLIVYGLGSVIGNWCGGMLADRFGPARPLGIALLALTVIEGVFSLTSTSFISAGLTVFIWGVVSASLFGMQQQRLLSVAPEHANVILAINNSTFYLGIAAGAALGGLALHYFPVTQISVIGAIFVLIALLLFALSTRLKVN
jgi:DHA1 family inner membrane transport protein